MDKRNNKLKNLIANGVEEDSLSGEYLRKAYWRLANVMQLSPIDWKNLLAEYVADERYVGRSNADVSERAGRLTNALTGGSVRGVNVDFTWKRLMEGLVLLHIETLTVSVEARKGNFKTERLVRSSCHPHLEMLKIVNRENEEELIGSANKALNTYFRNPRQTANQVMEHVLLKILWGFFAEYNIDTEMWHKLSSAYVSNPLNCPALSNRRNDMRHNLQSTIRYTKKITWKRFLQALKAIDIRTFTCTFKATNDKQRDYEVTFVVDLTELVFWSNANESE